MPRRVVIALPLELTGEESQSGWKNNATLQRLILWLPEEHACDRVHHLEAGGQRFPIEITAERVE